MVFRILIIHLNINLNTTTLTRCSSPMPLTMVSFASLLYSRLKMHNSFQDSVQLHYLSPSLSSFHPRSKELCRDGNSIISSFPIAISPLEIFRETQWEILLSPTWKWDPPWWISWGPWWNCLRPSCSVAWSTWKWPAPECASTPEMRIFF